MSDSPESTAAVKAEYPALSAAAGLPNHVSPMLTLGGVLGFIACSIGLALLLVGCAGFGRALSFAVVPAALAGIGLLLSIGGALWQNQRISQDTHVLQGIFVNLLGLIGAMFEMAVAFNWKIFYK